MAVYDDQDHKNGTRQDNQELDRLNDITGISPAEEQAMEDRAKTDDMAEREGLGDTESSDSGKSDDKPEKEKSLEDRLQDGYDSRRKEDEEAGFYNPDDKPKGIRARVRSTTRRQKGVMAAAGGGVIGLVVAISAIFGILNNFKLDHLLSSVDAVSFAKVNATFDRRSDRWVRTYVQLRLQELGGGITRDANGDYDLRSAGVDTDRPMTDWYRTMRSNRFEERMFNRQGIFFTSVVDGNGNVSFARITVDGQNSDSEILSNMTPDQRNAYFRESSNFDHMTRDIFEGAGSDRTVRREIKKAVNDNSRFFQVMRRRHIRKDIQNKVGIREWRFFEKTRDRARDKFDFKRKMVTRILPEDTKAGKFLTCIFGLGSCTDSTDHNHPDRQTGSPLSGDGIDDNGDRTTTDADGNITTRPSGESPGNQIIDEALEAADGSTIEAPGNGGSRRVFSVFKAEFIKKVLSKANIALTAVNLVDLLDTFHRVHQNITRGKLSAMVVAAKGIQAAQAYGLYGIMRDQVKAGDVTPEEVGYVMQGVNGIANSEAYDYFFKGSNASTTVSAMADKETFCSEDYVKQPNDYYFICDDIKIGGQNGGDTVQDWYDGPAFTIVRSVMEAYDAVRNNSPFSIVFDIVDRFGGFIENIISAVLGPILEATGLNDQMEKLAAWMGEKFMVMLGAGPILTGDFEADPAGLTMNMIGQGAAYTAEMNMRSSGAPIENTETAAYLNDITGKYLADEAANMSIYERYLALDNPKSMAATSLFSFINTPFSQSFSEISKTIFSSFGSIFTMLSGRAAAASDSYGAAELAGIDTFAFPTACMENDPLTVEPADMTNADEKNYVTADEIDWEFLDNDEAFWERLYEEAGDDEDRIEEVKEVYNCYTLDERVMGSLGHTSGYKDDDGLEDGGSSNSDSTASGPITLLGDRAFPLAISKSQIGGGMFNNGDTDTAGHPYTAYDLVVPQGTSIVAMATGRVVRISYDCNNTSAAITLNVPGQGISLWYGHMDPSTINVDEGQGVSAGDILGTVGPQDCKSGTAHLHIDATTNVGGDIYRPGCARDTNGGCPEANKSRFRSIGPDLYSLYEALPD